MTMTTSRQKGRRGAVGNKLARNYRLPTAPISAKKICASRVTALATLALSTFGLLLTGPAAAQSQQPLPLGASPLLYKMMVPPEGESPPEKIALGEKLFKDTRLSVDDTVACNTCHDSTQGFTDHRADNATSAGVGGKHGTRNSPTVLNAMFQASQFWDGRAPTLEDQAKLPILNPVEMAQKSPDDVVAKLRGIPEYVTAFKNVFGRDINYDDLASAIAAFERTQASGNSSFDRFLAGDQNAIDDSAKRGWALFNGKGRCTGCHNFNSASPLFSDQKFHNIGIAAHNPNFPELARKALKVLRSGDTKQIDELALQTEFSDLGRFLVTKNESDIGAFKTETLRNIGITGPYMHDGSLTTLWDVMDHYNKGGVPNPYLDGGMQRLGLTEPEIDDMVAWMFTLTDDRFAAFNEQEKARQTALKNHRPQREQAVVEGKKGDLGDLAPDPDLRNPATLGVF